MKKGIMKGIIALMLVFAMTIGMLASAETNAGKIGDYNRYFLFGSSTSSTSKVTPVNGTYGFWIYYSSGTGIKKNISFYYENNGKTDKAENYPFSNNSSTRFGSTDNSKWYEIYSSNKVEIAVETDSNYKETAYQISVPGAFTYNGEIEFRTHSTAINTPAADYLGTFKIKPRVTITGGNGGSSNYKKNCNVKIYLNGNLVAEVSNLAFPNDTRAYDEGTGINVTQKDENRYRYVDYTYSGNTYTINFYDYAYKLNYNLNGGSGSISAQSASASSATTKSFTISSTVPTRSGYKFLGWADSSTATTAQYSSGGNITLTGENGTNGNTGGKTHTIYAVWQKLKEYAVTYDANGGSGAPANQTKYEGQALTLSSTVPTRKGYTFARWNTAANGTGTNYEKGASYTGNAALALFAQWTPNTYKVTLNNQSATTAGTAAYWYQFNTTKNVNGETVYYWTNDACTTPLSSYKITVPTKTGYAFGGYWTETNGGGTQYVDANGTCINNLYAAVAGNTTLYAKWTPVTYTISYNLDGGSVSDNPTSYTVESNAMTLNNPTKEGYTFAGWTGTGLSSASKSVTVAKGSTGNRAYTATWTANSYTVKFNNVPDGTGTMTDVTHKFDTGYNLPANAFSLSYTVTLNDGTSATEQTANATFNGWEDRGNIIHKGVTYLYTTFDAPYYANKYNLAYNKYELISHYLSNQTNSKKGETAGLYPNGATVRNLSTTAGDIVNLHANFTKGSITLPNPTKEGYEFLGWYDGTTKIAEGGDTYTPGGNITLSAMWAVNTYEITYDYNGGTDPGNPSDFTVESGEIMLKNPTKEGYTFAGWTGANGSTPQLSVTISANSIGDRTYTANWTAENYTITYNLDGGSDSGNPTSYTIESADISLKAPTRAGYIFVGWTGSNGATAQTSVTIPTGSMGNKTYTATWLQAEYNVTWKNEDGTVLKTEKVKYNETPSYTGETPTKASTAQYEYTFKGWSPEVVPATKDATYTAQYTEKTREYSITFKNEDGTVLETKSVEYGKTPNYTGETPTKEQTESEVFAFAGWSPAIGSVVGEAEYIATYETAPRKYTVRWMNGETELASEEYEYNAMPTYKGEIPEKAKDNQYRYEFLGWSPDLTEVTEDATYEATFELIALPAVADLTIETKGCDSEQSFVFEVVSLDDASFVPIEVAIIGNDRAKIKELPVGNYEVLEEDSWSWRYGGVYKKRILVAAEEDNVVTFSDIRTPMIEKWLTGLASLFN